MKEEALKLADDLQKHFNCYNEYSDMIRRLVEELDKQGKPVAWMPIISFRSDKTLVISKVRTASHCVPLYTSSQTKPLSDDEIMKLLNGIEYNQAEVETSFDYEIRIAKAIEERHGIK